MGEFEYMTGAKEKKSKLKIIGIIFLGLIIVFSGVVGFGYYNYKQEIIEQQSINKEIAKQTEEKSLSGGDSNKIINPAVKIYDGSASNEVMRLDHEGTITGQGNITFTNVSNGYGFFKWLGSQVSTISKIWTDTMNATNVTTSHYCNSTHCSNITEFLVDTDTETNCSVAGACTGIAYMGHENSGDLNITGNFTVEAIKLENNVSSHYIKDNATCIKIYGSTSVLEIC